MRQAGRYLPEYRALKERHTLYDLFHNPQLAAEITLQPINRFPLDAAIIFSDILIVLEALGYTPHFPEGKEPFARPSSGVRSLDFVAETIAVVKSKSALPLIGFCGGPYTVARYTDRVADAGFLEEITEATIAYLQMQERAGVDVLQIFESRGYFLSQEEFEELSLPYLRKIMTAVSKPVILFTRNVARCAKEVIALEPAGIGVESEPSLPALRKTIPRHIAVQGNINPEILLSSREEVLRAVDALLESMRGESGFIANLGHGVLKQTPVEHVGALVEQVVNFS
jgi:uroporphyrinogen decarboxylase